MYNLEAVAWRCSVRKGVLRNFTKFTGKHLCQSLFFNKVIKKETVAQVFSCEFCEISKNTFSYRTTPVAASDNSCLRKLLILNRLKLRPATLIKKRLWH